MNWRVKTSAVFSTVLVFSGGVTAGAGEDDDIAAYQSAVSESAAQNQSYQGNPGNGSLLCAISPFDAVDGTFRGAGAGTPQEVVDNITVKAQDAASFNASCSGADTSTFTLTVNYEFEWRQADTTWAPIPVTQFECEAASLPGSGGVQTATVHIPGSLDCPYRAIYPEDDEVVGTFHRLHITLTTTLGDSIEGVSVPWPTDESFFDVTMIPFQPVADADGQQVHSEPPPAQDIANQLTPSTECLLGNWNPKKVGSGIRGVNKVICKRDFPHIDLWARLERHRWYGYQTLASRYNSCGTCDFEQATAGPWYCGGQGTYTYWNVGRSEILDWSGKRWYAYGEEGKRITC